LRNFDIVVFIIKSPDVAYSVDIREYSQSASQVTVLTIGTKGNRDNMVNVPVIKL